jgi:hypothetical protein
MPPSNRFDRNRVFRSPEDVARLAQHLSRCREISQFDDGNHKEAWALADSFSDLESSFREFLDEGLPKLALAEGEELVGLLFEVGVDFRHIIYHILEQQHFFRYIAPAKDSAVDTD